MSNMQATLRALLGRLRRACPELANGQRSAVRVDVAGEVRDGRTRGPRIRRPARLTFVGAGHLDNYILRATGETVTLGSTGTPLGLLPLHAALRPKRLTRWHRATCLVLFSDGVTDAQNELDEEFGVGRVLEILQGAANLSAKDVIDACFEAIDAFVQGAPQFDDITMMVVRRLK